MSCSPITRVYLFQGKEPRQNSRADSTNGSVDISDLTNQRDERTPTPEPTRKSPVIVRSASDDSIAIISVPSDHDLESYILEHSINIAPKLEPAYTEPPFPKLQEVNKSYMHELDPNLLCPPAHSSYSCYDNKSDSEAELESRREKTKVVRRGRKNRSVSPNPNELTLAQKLFLHKQVMAFRDSTTDNQATDSAAKTT